MSLHTLTLIPSGAMQAFPEGTFLSDALMDMGVALRTPCGGNGICGKCVVVIGRQPKEALACRTPITRDLEVHVPLHASGECLPLPEVATDSRLSLAVDIGTTTIRISLVDLGAGGSFELASFLNHQRRFGHDVVSRIAAAGNEPGRKSLRSLIVKAVSSRMENCLTRMGVKGERIGEIVFSGNTTMLYLLHGMDAAPLGRAPYTAVARDFDPLPAPELGFGCIPAATARTLPVLGAFTGADLVGGLALCRGMGIEKNAFFIDLGTNGELFVLDGSGRPFAASCAMGPALEGMNISWGMTADEGAITRIMATPHGLEHHTLGGGEPLGLTGTALVDLTAFLLGQGLISHRGAFVTSPEGAELPRPLAWDLSGTSKGLKLWGRVRVDQNDIRSLQLAKGASMAASLLLLEAAGRRLEDMERVLVAGALGEHLDPDHLAMLGFIPHFGGVRPELLGNTSMKAAVKACLDPGFSDKAASLRDETVEIPLSAAPGFQKLFIESLDFHA